MPSSWIKGSLRNSLNARLLQLTESEESVIMNFYKRKIMENQIGVDLNIEENVFRNATTNIKQKPDIQQVLKNGVQINENTKLFYE
jgi:3-isopropylmalate dehydratase small subunit